MTDKALSGRTALVTGAGAGLGAAVSYALGRAGASLVLAAGDAKALESLATEIGTAGGHAVAVPTDLGSPVSVRRLVEQTLGAFGRLDAALNNGRPGGMSLAMRHQLAAMRRAGRGRIVNLAPSGAGQAAVIELTRAAARDAAGSGVCVNAVAAWPYGCVEDVADAVVWLCSGSASLAAGETLHVPAVVGA